MDDKKNVFIKQKPTYSISLKSVMDAIPKDNYNEPQEELAKAKTEWRWRILNINNNKHVEISHQKHGEKRLYMNPSKCEWVERDISDDYDKYVEKVYYAYMKD